MTNKEIAEKLGVPENISYGLVRFLEAKGLMKTVGQVKAPNAKGKGSKVYSLKAGAVEALVDLVKLLPILP